jgi:TRAP-type uncharacterized transport system substrate-binding protein
MSRSAGLREPVTVRFRGDWGQANMHRICGWLAQEMGDRAPAGSRFAIWSGRGARDNVDALTAGEVDIAIVTPTAAIRVLYGDRDDLRCLGVIGQRDRLVVAVDADLPAQTVAELDRVTVATSPDDGVNLIGYLAHRVLRGAGTLAFHYEERPFPAIHRFAEGKADVLIQEAVMMPAWQRIADRRPVRYLALDEPGWPGAVVAAGYLPGLTTDLRTLDFSDFAVLCRADLSDEIAELATWCMVRTRRALAAQYAHIPPERSPLTYPLVPADMARTPVALHPAAARVYAEPDDALDDALMWS